VVSFGIIDSAEDARDVLNEIFGEGKFGLDFVEWMGDCPTGPNRWYAAFDGSRPVGTYGLLPMVVDVDGTHYKGALCNNVGTVPSHRGRGIFTDLGRYALGDMKADVAFGVPNEAAVPGHRKVGWARCGKLELLSGESTDGVEEYRRMPFREFKFVPFFKHIPTEGKPRVMAVRGWPFWQWRYSKPGQEYFQSLFPEQRYAIWKEFEGRRQILETNDWQLAACMGGWVDIWQLEGSRISRHLKGLDFESRFDRDLIVYAPKVDVPMDVDRIRFELCENDVM
jgi:GNAT superfamily N-acetyltransferase